MDWTSVELGDDHVKRCDPRLNERGFLRPRRAVAANFTRGGAELPPRPSAYPPMRISPRPVADGSRGYAGSSSATWFPSGASRLPGSGAEGCRLSVVGRVSAVVGVLDRPAHPDDAAGRHRLHLEVVDQPAEHREAHVGLGAAGLEEPGLALALVRLGHRAAGDQVG